MSKPQSRSKLNKRKPVSVADVPVDGIDIIDETMIDVPSLTEQHMYALNSAVDNRSVPEERNDRFCFDPKEMVVKHRSSMVSGELSKPLGVSPRDEVQLKLMAYYKKVHGGGLRVHEELARNLMVNIADVVYLEDRFVTVCPEVADVGARVDIPPVCSLLLFLFTCEAADIEKLFVKLTGGTLDGEQNSTPSEANNKMVLTKLLNKLRHDKFSSADDDVTLQQSLLFKEVLRGLQSKDHNIMARWIGVTSLLCATIKHLSQKLIFKGQLFDDDPVPDLHPTKSKMTLPTTTIRMSIPERDPALEELPAAQHAKFYFVMKFSSAPEALRALTNMGKSERAINIPLLQPLTPTKLAHAPELKRPEGFIEPNFELDENGATRTFSEKIALLCSDWYHQDDVLAEDETDEHPATEAVFHPVDVTIELQAIPSSAVSLSLFSRTASEDEHVLSGFPVASLVSIDAEKLFVTLREEDPPLDPVSEQASLFFPHVLADAKKASITARRISTRLIQQFVKPHHCHRHPTQLFSHFCDVCRLFICPACCKEIHLPHTKTPIAAFCVDESVRLQPKKQIVLTRLDCLKKLRDSIDIERGKMKDVVNTGVNDVLSRLKDRQAELHDDANKRAHEQKKELQREQKNVNVDSTRIQQAKCVIAETKKGKVSPVPRFKLHERWQVNNQLLLKLPTEHMKKLVRLLTWSNPSKYLTHLVYPPQGEVRK